MRWQENQTIAVSLFALAMAGIALNDTLIKLMSPSIGLPQIMVIRSVIAVAIFLSLVRIRRDLAALDLRGWVALSLRGFMLALAMSLYFTSLIMLPIANAMALFFTAPLFITLGSVILFKEQLTIYRILALIMGMVGTWLTLPSFELGVSIGAVLALSSALCYASFQLLTRGLRDVGSTLAMSTVQTLAYVVISGTWLAVATIGNFTNEGSDLLDFLLRGWVWPNWNQTGLIAICTATMLFLSVAAPHAYRQVEASAMAPFEFSTIGAGIVFGIIILGEWPDAYAYTGAALIAAAGLLMVQRAKVRQMGTNEDASAHTSDTQPSARNMSANEAP